MKSIVFLFTSLLAFGCAPAPVEIGTPSYPKCILLIRHAEKPATAEMSVHLNDAGKKRAESLVGLFEKSDSRPEPFAKPDALFATKNTSKSHRPIETLEPLGKALNQKIHDHNEHDDVDGFAKYLFDTPKYKDKTLLVCWHHSTIPALAKKLGIADPPKWADDVFDRVWEITFDSNGKATLKDRPQHLMPGDGEK